MTVIEKIDEEIIENEKKVTMVIEGKSVKRIRLVRVRGIIVVRDNNNIDEVWLENCNLDKFRNLSHATTVIKNTKIKDGLIVDLRPLPKSKETAIAPS